MWDALPFRPRKREPELAVARRYPPGTHAGIAVLRVDSQDARTVADTLTTFLGNDTLGELRGCIVVVRGHLVRIRRPD